jgi:hypothetical protein
MASGQGAASIFGERQARWPTQILQPRDMGIFTIRGFKQSGFEKDLSREAVKNYKITKHVMVAHS